MSHRSDLVAGGIRAITPSDTTQLNLRGLLCTADGTAVVVDGYGVETSVAMVQGMTIVCQIARVKAASTGSYVGFVP